MYLAIAVCLKPKLMGTSWHRTTPAAVSAEKQKWQSFCELQCVWA
jgi:hypothetical protein